MLVKESLVINCFLNSSNPWTGAGIVIAGSLSTLRITAAGNALSIHARGKNPEPIDTAWLDGSTALRIKLTALEDITLGDRVIRVFSGCEANFAMK